MENPTPLEAARAASNEAACLVDHIGRLAELQNLLAGGFLILFVAAFSS